MKLPRLLVMAGLAALLVAALLASWQFARRRRPEKAGDRGSVLRAGTGYWTSMCIAGTLGTLAQCAFGRLRAVFDIGEQRRLDMPWCEVAGLP